MRIAAIAACLATQAMAQSTWTSELLVNGLARPVSVKSPPGDMDRLFIVEQRTGNTGRVRIYKHSTGELNSQNFIAISGVSTGSEQGLLDIAFHPDFETNGLFYLHYNQANLGGDTVINEYGLFAPDIANPTPLRTLFVENQPFSNHNGGWIDFGPDGYLYISLGDGGSANDPGNRAQDITNQFLGKMLRIDVDGDDFPADPDRNYAIPASNPFVGIAGDDEIWAYGLRNAWRCAFDPDTGDLWMGDVGQNAWEEIDYQPASSVGGENYGWRCYEGAHNFNTGGCPPMSETVLPITEFSHAGGNCSVTGGVVYRGCEAPDWAGTYFYADFCSNDIWVLRQENGAVTFQDEISADIAPSSGSISGISGFGQDNLGNVYICDLFGGEVFQLVVDHQVADWNNDDVIDIFDILAFTADFSNNDASTDVNGDTLIDIFDVLTFLDWFSNTCG